MAETVNLHQTMATQRFLHGRHQVAHRDLQANQMTLEKFEDMVTSELIYEIRKAYLELATSFTIEVPRTWWDHFKESHFPKWAQRIFLVQYCEVETNSVRVCDHIQVPKNKNHLEWLSMDRIKVERYGE